MLNLTDRCRIALGLATIVAREHSYVVWAWDPDKRSTVVDTYHHASTDRMPSDASGEATLGAEDHGMKCRIVPSIVRPGIRHNSAHRISVECDQCGSWVPSGRYVQHVGRGTCKATAAQRDKLQRETDAQHAWVQRDKARRNGVSTILASLDSAEINLAIGEAFAATFKAFPPVGDDYHDSRSLGFRRCCVTPDLQMGSRRESRNDMGSMVACHDQFQRGEVYGERSALLLPGEVGAFLRGSFGDRVADPRHAL